MTLLQTKSRISSLFLLLLLFTVLSTVAQSDNSKFLPNITPPSPTAGELGKFGNVPVGLFTGAANLSIPLLSFKTKNLESPLSLYYGSNGIKTDEVASAVGLGWNLNFGGVIARTVRDKNDESQTNLDTPDNLEGGHQNLIALQFFKAAAQSNADTESDQYSFNFNGNSGKFVYDKNKVPVLVNNQKIRIERTGFNNVDFLLTDIRGIQYYFTEKETTAFRNQGEGHAVISASVTAWYLSKIVHPDGSEISLVYEDSYMEYTASNSQTFIKPYNQLQADCWNSVFARPATVSPISALNMDVLGKRIIKIHSNTAIDGYLTFTYTAPGINEEVEGNSKIEQITLFNAENMEIESVKFNYLKTTNQRVFLQDISFKDTTKKYIFQYNDQNNFPKRLTKSQDHWGYYNGKANVNLVPKNIKEFGLDQIDYNGADKEPDMNFTKIGLLNKIVYPTKGYTEFEYESNTYWGEKRIYPPKTTLKIERKKEDYDEVPKEITFTSPISQEIIFDGWVTFVSDQEPKLGPDGNPIPDSNDTGKYYAGAQIVEASAPDRFLEFHTYTHLGEPINHPVSFRFIPKVSNPFYFNAKAGKTYKVLLSKDGLNVFARTNFSYYNTAYTKTDTNLETGGVRIKSTKDFASAEALPVYKRYYYAHKDDIHHSSGNKGRTPVYIDIAAERKMCPVTGDSHIGCLYVDLISLVLTSSSMITLFDTGSTNCYYKYVTISEGGDNFENGGEMKEFKIHRDSWVDSFDETGQPKIVNHDVNGESKIFGVVDIKSAPFTNFGWDNGLEIRSQVFRRKESGSSFVVVAETENKYKLDPSYNKEIKSYSVRKNFNELCPVDIRYTCDEFDPKDNKYHPCYQKQTGQVIIVPFNDNLSVVEYKTKGYWFYLESTLSKSYDLNGLNPVESTTTYQYNNPSHIQLTSQSIKSSLGEALESKFYYPQDLPTEPFVTDMIVANRIDTQLKTETFKAGTKTSEQKTVYAKEASTGNRLLPKSIFAAKFPNSLANSLEKKITFDKYDDQGNILQYTLEDGRPVAIIWGYNKTKPIAKIENATYDQVLAAYVANDTTFRTNLPDALITTYTYKPLVGVSTVTDPKGFTTFYEYDDFNRLKVIKDNLGHVVSENQYQYKN